MTGERPKPESVCAVIPAYNCKQSLANCLELVRRQTRPIDEIIVVDNASTDGTGEMIRERFDGSVTYVRLPENLGGAGGFDHGMRLACEHGHDWIWCLDSDVMAPVGVLEDLLSASYPSPVPVVAKTCMFQDPDTGGVYPGGWLKLPGRCGAYPRNCERGEIVPVELAGFGCFLVRAEAAQQAGFIRRDLFLYQDDFFFLHELRKHGEIIQVGSVVVVHPKPGSKPTRVRYGREHVTVEAWWKIYYVIRNQFLFEKCYGLWRAITWFTYSYLRSLCGIILFDDYKWYRLRLLSKAYWDGLLGRTGKRVDPGEFQRRYKPFVARSAGTEEQAKRQIANRKLQEISSPAPLRICLAYQDYPDESPGGIATYTRTMAQALAQAGHTVVVVTRSRGAAYRYQDGPVTVYKIAPRILRYSLVRRYAGVPIYSLFLALKVRQLVRAHGIQLVEFPELVAEGFAYSFIKPRPVPMAVRVHTPMKVLREMNQTRVSELVAVYARFLDWMERRSILAADLVTAPSHAVVTRSREALQLGGRPIYVYPNPVDTELFHPAPTSRNNSREVLYVGLLQKRKGVEVFRTVIPAVLKEVTDARFIFIGQDCRRYEDNEWTSKYILGGIPEHLRERVSFLPRMKWQDLGDYYQRAAICVLPSLFDNFPSTCLEAMACGCVVIGSRNGGMAEMITDGVDGILVDPTDAREIVRHIVSCLNHDNHEMRARARAKVLSQFSFDAVGRKATEVYKLALRRQPMRKARSLEGPVRTSRSE